MMDSIKRFYIGLFLKLYNWSLKKRGEDSGPEYTSLILLSVHATFNLASIIFPLGTLIFSQEEYKGYLSDNLPIIFISIYVTNVAVFYILFIRNRRFISLSRRYKEISFLLAFVYVLVSIGALIISLVLINFF
jgi:hypothetical protein